MHKIVNNQTNNDTWAVRKTEENRLLVAEMRMLRWIRFETRAQDYKGKHTLDSKLISDSVFGAHLSFCQKQGTIMLFKIKLKTHTSNSGSWRCCAGGGNVTKIGAQ